VDFVDPVAGALAELTRYGAKEALRRSNRRPAEA
jgi:hypothetical protein